MVIIRAAIMFQNGEVVEGHDYGQIATLGNKLSFTGDRIHGFTTSSGIFVLPHEAVEIALEAGQIAERVDELTPDMIWPYIKDNE